MTKKLSAIVILSLLIVAFLAVGVFAAKSKPNVWDLRKNLEMRTIHKLAGTERAPLDYDDSKGVMDLGFDEKASLSPGLTIGTSTYDLQSNCRMNRQVEWRSNQMVHFIWMKSTHAYAGTRQTAYEAWDPDDAQLVFAGTGGGCDIHAVASEVRSGYVSLDVDTEGKAVICNHYDPGFGGLDYSTTVFYDNLPASCFLARTRDRFLIQRRSMVSRRVILISMTGI